MRTSSDETSRLIQMKKQQRLAHFGIAAFIFLTISLAIIQTMFTFSTALSLRISLPIWIALVVVVLVIVLGVTVGIMQSIRHYANREVQIYKGAHRINKHLYK